MAVVCHNSSFATVNGELTLARAGSWRPLVTAYQPSSSDGTYGSHPTPGKTVIDIDATWTNTTGVPHVVWGWLDRAPWTIITTNARQSRFQERFSYAVGVSAKAPTPPPFLDAFGSCMENFGTYVFWWLVNAARATVSYGSQDRGSQVVMPCVRVEPGEGVNVRYQVALITDFNVAGGGVPKFESYARYGQLSLFGAPAAV